MAPARLSIASVVNEHATAERYLLASVDRLEEPATIFALSNETNELGTNLSSLYNILKRLDGPAVRAFVHPDVSLGGDLVARVSDAIEALASGPRWGALGIVGRSWEGEYVWSHEVSAPAPVCTLDGCFLVTRADLGVDFDARTFDDLHCVVEDYCLQCHDAGFGVWVIPATAEHHGSTYAREGSRWGAYDRYRKRLDKKWRRRFPGLTTT